ncbi:MAG: hypothetical protein HC929_17935 [Leptolyngbyaceae cyanobacterium SM2_5_2]|nr:hypothetical protein [Leptolyngbyaceae cyanobacterium SM2_5_2]
MGSFFSVGGIPGCHAQPLLEQSGHILLGQTNDQTVQVTLLYPAEMANAYWPAAKAILDSLEFEPSLLPINSPKNL